ncbi:hypothetical protein ACF09C_37105 [Streptomyces sp. NPDC014870]|uniref:hypothetical protein n=1 Tax=Streptomyces sp. NPDC014870 TaxID=3364925 RepID=UPI0037008499
MSDTTHGTTDGSTDGTADGTTDGERLAEWIEDVPARVMRLDTWYTPADFTPDMSAESLGLLEDALVFTYRPEGTPESQDFLQGAMAYLGEALMAAGGGRWGWSADDRPVVLPDPALGLAPLDPLGLIVAAQERDRSGAFTEAADELRAAVAAHRERVAEPGWKPAKHATPGLDPGAADAPHPWLAGWLAERADGHPAWAADAGAGSAAGSGTWDFSPESLETLGRLMVDRFPDKEVYRAAEGTPFVQGAVWYVGEVAVRHRHGAWTYREAAAGIPRDEVERNIYLERPFVNQPTVRDGVGEVPFYALLATVGDKDPGTLRERLARYRDHDPEGDPVEYREA